MINNLTCFSLCICLSKITQIGKQLLLGPFYISSLELEVLRTAQHLWTPIKKHCPIMLLCFLSNLHLTELLWLMWCGSTVERTHVKELINTRFESGLYQFLPVILVNLYPFRAYFYICKMNSCGPLCCLHTAAPLVLGRAPSNHVVLVEAANQKSSSDRDFIEKPESFTGIH